MRKLLAVFGVLASSAWGQITWTKVWATPAGGPKGSFYNGYLDVHYDAFTRKTWIYSTDTTAGADSIYSSRLHYFDSNTNSDTLVGSSNQPSTGGCLGSSATWPSTHHPAAQICAHSLPHRTG